MDSSISAAAGAATGDSERRLTDDEIHKSFESKLESMELRLFRLDQDTDIEDLKKAFFEDEALRVFAGENPKAIEFLRDLSMVQVKVKQLVLLLRSWSVAAYSYIQAASRFKLESFQLKYDASLTEATFIDEGRCFVSLLESSNLTFLSLQCTYNFSEFEGLVQDLSSQKCGLRELHLFKVIPKPKSITLEQEEQLCRALTSLSSLQRLSVRGLALSEKAMECLAAGLANPDCNIWDFEFSDVDNFPISRLADALQNPNCQLRKLGFELDEFHLINLEDAQHFSEALQSPHCKLEHLHLKLGIGGRYYGQRSFFLEELGKACQAEECGITSMTLMLNFKISAPKGVSDFGFDIEKFLHSNITCFHGRCLHETKLPSSMSTQLVEALEHPRCRLRHVHIPQNTLPSSDETRIVDFLEKNFECPLETLEIPWASDGVKVSCSRILERNKVYHKGTEGEAAEQELQRQPSNAKLFICGHPGAGKTTIRKNLCRRYGVPRCLQREVSTYGIDLQTLSFGNNKLLLCDLAGQREFHALHHYFVRGSDKDLFLIVCKAPAPQVGQKHLEDQLRYWLRFIVSHRSFSEHKPRVLIALNYFPSSAKPPTRRSMETSMRSMAVTRCKTLIQEYSGELDFGNSDENIFGLVATRITRVQPLKKRLETSLAELLGTRPKIPDVCQELMRRLDAPRRKQVVVTVQELRDMLGVRDVDERQSMLFKVSLMHLHDMGEVIYFEQDDPSESQQFIILDVKWFLRDVVGIFLPRLSRRRAAQNAATMQSKLAVEDVVLRLAIKGCEQAHIPYILSSLHKLGVLLLDDPEKPREVMVLAFLKEELNEWPNVGGTSEKTYWGRRFECKDAKKTLLPSGIFGILQVKLASSFSGRKVGDGWLYLVENDIGVIVKVGGPTRHWHDRHWIDVLVRIPDESRLGQADTLFHKVKDCVFEICSSYSWGCPSVELEEKVIRPKSVEPMTCDEAKPLAEILDRARSDLFYNHTWELSLDSSPVFEIMLPSEREMYFNHKAQDLKLIEYEVNDSLAQTDASAGLDAFQPEDEYYVLKQELQSLEARIVGEIRESKQEIIGEIKRLEVIVKKQMETLQLQGERILGKLTLNLEFQWPRYPYVTNSDNVLQRFSRSTFGTTWKLHLLCEHGQPHHFEDQKGIKIPSLPEWLKEALPVLVPTLRVLFFLGKVLAAVYVGGALPIPSPEKLFKGLEEVGFASLMAKIFGGIQESLKSKDLYNRSPTKDELQRFYEKFLEKTNLTKDFGLYHVLTSKHEHAWVCDEHKTQYQYTM